MYFKRCLLSLGFEKSSAGHRAGFSGHLLQQFSSQTPPCQQKNECAPRNKIRMQSKKTRKVDGKIAPSKTPHAKVTVEHKPQPYRFTIITPSFRCLLQYTQKTEKCENTLIFD